jgi:hypothetical protein
LSTANHRPSREPDTIKYAGRCGMVCAGYSRWCPAQGGGHAVSVCGCASDARRARTKGVDDVEREQLVDAVFSVPERNVDLTAGP